MLALALTWRELPSLPVGLGGQFVGTVGDKLVVAGGSYWRDGTKTWVDTIYTLGRGDKQWQLSGKLPEPLGYGAVVTHNSAMYCLGGQTPNGPSPRVYRIGLNSDVTRLADLPEPVMMFAAAVLHGRVYIAGGQSSGALKQFRSLALPDLESSKPNWKVLESWPGPATFFAHMTAAGDSIYLVGGADLTPERVFLKQAYAYSPSKSWRKIADYPHAVQAGVAAYEGSVPLIFGGSDGILAPFESIVKDDHPGFHTIVWAFDGDKWVPFGRMPVSLVTTGIARWGDEWVIAGGEDRPGNRSSRVIAAKVRNDYKRKR